MKKIIFTLLIFSQSFIVNCSVMEVVTKAVNEIVGYFVKTIEDVRGSVEKYIINHYVNQPVKPRASPVRNNIYSIPRQGMKNEAEDDIINLKNGPSIPQSPPPLPFWQGRDMESHSVLTKDGYYLTVHRVHTLSKLHANRTVLLHHGLLGSSADWILLGGTKSLPFILSDTGYDVWITNARGNYYSRAHLFMKPDNLDYWNFSWQEIGEFDLPAVIDYIRKTNNSTESISYIGHSMGATALLVLLSTSPKYNEYLRMGILLAPLAFMNNVEGPIKLMTDVSADMMKLVGAGEFLPSRKVPYMFAASYCDGPMIVCRNPLFFLSGIHLDQRWNAGFVSRLLYYIPAGGSTNTLMHYWQLSKTGKFHRYNRPHSEFSLNNVTLPIALISSSNDWLAPASDVLRLFLSLINPIDHHIIKNMNVAHTDFVWGADANVLVFDKIIEYLDHGLLFKMTELNEVTDRNQS